MEAVAPEPHVAEGYEALAAGDWAAARAAFDSAVIVDESAEALDGLGRRGDLECPGGRRRDHWTGLRGGFRTRRRQSCFQLAGMFPGSTLGDAVRPVARRDGTTDLYIIQDRFHEQFCADVPAPQAARMAATQRPATQEALTAASGEQPLWRELPSSFVIAEEDCNIPAALQHFMAERAGAQRTLAIPGASHAVVVSQPQTTADLILEAAALPAAA
jgi:pimeloyl-ACP methyl ester carboxylesterase